ncbi:MAG TPA: hypothetical protein VEA38_16575 [Terriglobales bacterium]|nr:hypothetical protein [Terriglobales bacterium]
MSRLAWVNDTAFLVEKMRPRSVPNANRPKGAPHPYRAYGDPRGTQHPVTPKLGDGRDGAYREVPA